MRKKDIMETFVNFIRMFLRAEVAFWGAAMKPKLLKKKLILIQMTLFLDLICLLILQNVWFSILLYS